MYKRLINKKDLEILPRGFKRVLTKKTYKLPALTLVMMMLALGFTLSDADILAYAAEDNFQMTTYTTTVQATQSPRWHVDNTGTWYLKNEAGTGNTINSWFQDLDGSWYLLAPNDGHMYAGLIHDTITDRWYYCQIDHNGWYGRMAYTDGVYTVNGQQVYLTFNQLHDGTFGAITSGLESLRGAGVETQEVAGIPTESETATSNGMESTDGPGLAQGSSGTLSEYDKELKQGTSGILSEYDKQFDGDGNGVLDERELINKQFVESLDSTNLGITGLGGMRDWK